MQQYVGYRAIAGLWRGVSPVAMQQALVRHGVPHDVVRRTEWGHAFLYMPHDPTAADAFERIGAFLDEHVRDR